MDYDKKFFGNNLESVEIPEEVDFVIDRAIKRAKNRYKNIFLKGAENEYSRFRINDSEAI